MRVGMGMRLGEKESWRVGDWKSRRVEDRDWERRLDGDGGGKGGGNVGG